MHQGHGVVAARHHRATKAARGARATTTTQVQLGCVTRERQHTARARTRGGAQPWRVARNGNRGGLLLCRSSLTCLVSKPAHICEQSRMHQGHDDVAARNHRATEAARGARATTTTQVQLGCVTRERQRTARARTRGGAQPWRVARNGNKGGLLLYRSSLTCFLSNDRRI